MYRRESSSQQRYQAALIGSALFLVAGAQMPLAFAQDSPLKDIGFRHLEVLDTATLLKLARKQAAAGHYADAQAVYKHLADKYTQVDGPDSIKLISLLPDWASAAQSRGQFAEAQELYQRAIKVAYKKLKKTDIRLPQLINQLAKLNYQHGDYASASEYFKTAVAANTKAQPKSYKCMTTALLGVADSAFQRNDYAEAESNYQRALRISEHRKQPPDAVQAKCLLGLANVLALRSKTAEAIPMYKKALSIFEGLKPAPAVEIANVLQNMANSYVCSEDYSAAEKNYKKALATLMKLPTAPPLLDAVQHNLATLYGLEHNTVELENLYRQIIAKEAATAQPKDPRLIRDMTRLAEYYVAHKNPASAEETYKQLLLVSDPFLAGEESTAPLLEKIAALCIEQKKRTDAENLIKQSRDIYLKHKDCEGAGRTIVALGDMYAEAQDHATALSIYRNGLDFLTQNGKTEGPAGEQMTNHLVETFLVLKRANGNKDNPTALRLASGADTPDSLMPLPKRLHDAGANNYNRGDYPNASRMFLAAAELQESLKGADDPEIISHLVGSANSEYMLSHFQTAENRYQTALDLCRRTKGEQSKEVANILTGIASIYSEEKKYQQAEDTYLEASRIFHRTGNLDTSEQARCLQGLASVYCDQGQFERAEPLYKKAIAIRERLLGDNHPALASSLAGLAHLYEKKADYLQAEVLYKRSLAILEKRLDSNHPLLAENMSNLGEIYRKQGRYGDAEPLFKLALGIYEKSKDYDKSDYVACVSGYATLLEETKRVELATEIASKAHITLSEARKGVRM